jgi:hypothetical protein
MGEPEPACHSVLPSLESNARKFPRVSPVKVTWPTATPPVAADVAAPGVAAPPRRSSLYDGPSGETDLRTADQRLEKGAPLAARVREDSPRTGE